MGLGADGEFVHAVHEGVPGEGGLLLTKQRVGLWLAGGGCGTVVEEKADVDVGGRGEWARGAVGEEFKRHGGCVVGYTVKVCVGLRKLGEAEEGLETGVGAELDVYF